MVGLAERSADGATSREAPAGTFAGAVIVAAIVTRASCVVVVSSPGAAGALHWSHSAAAELAGALARPGCDVLWFAAVRRGQQLPPLPDGVELRTGTPLLSRSLHQVDADNADLALEIALVRALRERPAQAVVHLGAGARGSPNIPWLAERMGSCAFAVVAAPEVVCHRGDLIDRAGRRCDQFLDAERCRGCCATGRWKAPRSDDLRNRSDLLAASLLASTAVFCETAAEAAQLGTFGIPAARLRATRATAAIVDEMLRSR